MLSLVLRTGQSGAAYYARLFLTLAIMTTLIGCAGSGAKYSAPHTTPLAASVAKQSIDAPKQRTRAMDIFFYQSRVGDAVMNKYPFLDLEDADPNLVAAEARMMAACSHLAQAALHKVSGGEPGVQLKFKVFLTLDSCEHAARRVETLLSSGSILADNSL